MKIFKEHSSKTCILDDFSFYEVRQKTILEKKAKQTQKQARTRKKIQKSFHSVCIYNLSVSNALYLNRSAKRR